MPLVTPSASHAESDTTYEVSGHHASALTMSRAMEMARAIANSDTMGKKHNPTMTATDGERDQAHKPRKELRGAS